MEGPTLKEVLKTQKHQDFVEYFVFPPSASLDDPQDLLYKLNAAAQDIIGDYMWQNDCFGLRIPSVPLSKFDEDTGDKSSTEENIVYFYGVTRFGDNVEDEWFIVHILKELSKQFPGIVVRVIDNDGEFLLIEAADFLPSWAESDASCRQRVYLYEGRVHLIPKAKSPEDPTVSPLPRGTPKVSEAVNVVRNDSEITLADDRIQNAIDSRIGEYPEKMEQNSHSANLMLPPKLAAILRERPSLVPPAVLAFYHRDPVDVKAARLMTNFNPSECLVKTRVRFTKCLYAMLSKQDFRPDAKSGWTLPRPTSNEYKGNSLGAKLTTGFEILLSRASPKNETVENGASSLVDSRSPGWLRYEEALKKTGYFRGYLEGSKSYQQLLVIAQEFYKHNLNGEIQDDTKERSIIRDLINLVQTVKVDVDLLKGESVNLPADDDDSWMDIKPEDLESLLEAKFQSGGLNPQEIPAKLKEFMKQLSDFSGVETNSGGSPTSNSGSPRGKSSNGVLNDTNLGDFGEPFDFKADEFVSAMDKLLHDLGGPDKDWEDSEDSYGSDEDDFDVNLEDIKKMHSFSKDSKIHELMQQMDAELATTEVGKTFTSDPTTASGSSSSNDPGGPSSSTAAGSSGSKVTTASVDELDEFDEEEGLTPVNIDMNALANILESFQSQEGPSGPSANLLRSVGFDISRMKK